jgi:hypothetical protein
MTREENVEVVETFLRCLADKDFGRLPIGAELTVESPLVPKLRDAAAMEYVKKVAAAVRSIRILQHIVEGDRLARLFEEETVDGAPRSRASPSSSSSPGASGTCGCSRIRGGSSQSRKGGTSHEQD